MRTGGREAVALIAGLPAAAWILLLVAVLPGLILVVAYRWAHREVATHGDDLEAHDQPVETD